MTKPMQIRMGWLIDGTGSAIRRDIVIQVDNGLITSLKRAQSVEVAATPEALCEDFSGCTVIPGLVDCHVHLTMSGTRDEVVRRRQLKFGFQQAGEAIDAHLHQHLVHGIVAVRDGGDSAGHTLQYRNELLYGNRLPIRLKAAGKAWRARGRYGRLIGDHPPEGCTLAECISHQEKGADHIKVINSGLNSLKEYAKETPPQFSTEDLEAAIKAAHDKRLKVMVHANGRRPVRDSLDAGCSSIEHGFFMGSGNIQRMADLQVFWAPTAFSMKAYSELLPHGSLEAQVAARNLDHQAEQIRYAREMGAPVVIGTDSGGLGIDHGTAFAEELSLLIQAGFTTEDAIRCATLDGARLLGLEREIGQIKPGIPATFVVVEGGPSDLPQSLRTPVRVYIRGDLYHSLR